MLRPVLLPVSAAAGLALFGHSLGGESLLLAAIKGLTELTAFGLVAWTWWYLVRHGLPRLILSQQRQIDRISDHYQSQVATLAAELRAEREQQAQDNRRLADALIGLTANCAARFGTDP